MFEMLLHLRIYLLVLVIAISNNLTAQPIDQRMFVFGHSLIDHRPPAIPTPSDETTVLHWMHLLAAEAGNTYAGGGKYGFLPWHDDLPPFSQWGYDLVTPVWDSDYEPFSDANVTSIMITPANFIQYQPANMPHPIDYSTTVVNSTETIFDWVNQQEPGVKFYIYENWPEMNIPNFPPTNAEFATYNTFTQGSFHDWWVDYQDFMLASRPQLNTRLIPVGSIISKIITDLYPNQIPVTELYEDGDPHGRATIYFLAGLITYMATYEEQAPSTYTVPTIVHSTIRNNYTAVSNFIWNELVNFNLPNGDSRVFCTNPNPNLVLTLELNVLLEGCYNLTTQRMNNDLQANNLIPLQEPYTALGYTHYHDGGGEATVPIVMGNTQDPIIDWLFIELRDASDSTTIIATRSVLLRASGSVADIDGSNAAHFLGLNPGDYWVVVRHHNHVDAMTTIPVTLTGNSNTSYNFTSQGAFGQTPMITTADGNYALISGDLNGDQIVNASDRSAAWNNRNQIGYLRQDANLSSIVDAADRSKIWNNRNLAGEVPQ